MKHLLFLSALKNELELWSIFFYFLRGLDQSNPLFYRDVNVPCRESGEYRKKPPPVLFAPTPRC
jgi:hypothetical protein